MAAITDQIFINEYRKFQRQFKNVGTDLQFAKYLTDKNYQTVNNIPFNISNIAAQRRKLEIKSPVTAGSTPSAKARSEAVEAFSKKEVAKVNDRLKYVKDVDIKNKVLKKFNLESFANFKTAYYPSLKDLDSLPDKIDKALKTMLVSDEPLKKPMVNQIMKLTGMSLDGIRDNINKSKTYQNIKESADVIKRSKGMPRDFYTLPFKEQLEYAAKFDEGMPRYTGMGNQIKYSAKPQNKIMEYAIRSWNNKRGSLEGPIQFFKKGSNTPIKWERGKKLPYGEVNFSYEGNRHSFNKLRSPVYMEKYFSELYQKQKSLNNLNSKMVDNPFKKGQKISVRELNRIIQVDGYGYKPRRGTLDIFHGKRGVADRPFTDLTYGASDINKMEEVFKKSTTSKDPNIAKSEFNKIRKVLLKSTVDPKTGKKLIGNKLDQSIIARSNYQAEAMMNNKFKGYEELKKMVMEEAKNPNSAVCKSLGRFRKDGGRIGFASGSGCIIEATNAIDDNPIKFAQNINKIPEETGAFNKVKSAASKFLNFAKADYNLMGKMGKFGKFGAVAGLGAAAAGVKEFFSDDPSTYLSNENQQKNMLIGMVTEPIAEPTEKPAILEAQMPVLGAALVAGTIPGAKDTYLDAITGRGPKGPAGSGLPANIVNKPVGKFRATLGINKGVLGKGLAALGTPAGMLATEPFFIGNQIAEGDSVGEIATNPMNYLGAAFASPLTKMATKNVSPTMANIMRLGLSPARLATLSRFGQFGLAAGLGIAGVNLFNDYRNNKGFFEKDNVGPVNFGKSTQGIGGINFD